MIALLQRVTQARVEVDGVRVAVIARGLLVFLGVERADDAVKAEKILHKILNYRVFEDEQGKMNCSLKDVSGELLLVPQFTLAANTKSGMRPSFSSAATPVDGKLWFDYLVELAGSELGKVQMGRFGSDMQISLINDGPVTFWLQV